MILTVLGCSGSMPGPNSAASSYLVTGTDGTNLLLDLGSGAFGPLQRHLQPHELDAVVLSHLHPDHCADLTALAVWLRYGPGIGRGPMRVLGPSGTAARIAELTHLGPQEVAETFQVETFTDRAETTVGGLTVTPFQVEHPVEAYGVRVSESGPEGAVVLGYTGDTDACTGVSALARGVDLLLAEAAFPEEEPVRGIHLTGSRAGQLARDAGARAVVLTHIQPWVDAEGVLAAARERLDVDVPVGLARPGASYAL